MKVVVLGTGRMGRNHIRVIREMGLDLVGICDPNQESLLLAQKEQAVLPDLHYTNANVLLGEKKPECVVIASTAPSHREYTELAAAFGAKYILCEKPMATSLVDCDAMIESCQNQGVHLAVNHQMRFMEQYVETKKLIESDAFGGLTSITIIAGNFGMAMNGTHYFEMLRYMTDENPWEVTAWFSEDRVPNPRGSQFEDRAGAVRITTKSGKRFYMEIGSDQGNGLQVIYAGRYGQIVVDELAGRMSLVYREDQYRDLPTTRYGMPSIRFDRTIQPADVISPTKAILTALLDHASPPTGEEGRLAVATLISAYVSDEQNHRTVRLDDIAEVRERAFPWA